MSEGLQHNFSQPMNGGLALAEMLQRMARTQCLVWAASNSRRFTKRASTGIGHNLINDERCGAFMADAYARVTGKAVHDGIKLGLGVTNLVTGMVESLNAGVPMIVIAGDANRSHAWKNMTQECRQVDILRPAAKELIRIEVGERHSELVRRAWWRRPGGLGSLCSMCRKIFREEYSFTPDDFWVGSSDHAPGTPHSARVK